MYFSAKLQVYRQENRLYEDDNLVAPEFYLLQPPE